MTVDREDADRVADLIAVQEGRSPVPLLDDAGIAAVLRDARRIAVVGVSPRPFRPANSVFAALRRAGFDVVPVNPDLATFDGLPCHPTVAAAVEATGPVDIVDVFRRPSACPDVARDAVAARARCLWLQQGIVSLEAGRIAHAGGLAVVMDRCTSVEVHRHGIRPAR